MTLMILCLFTLSLAFLALEARKVGRTSRITERLSRTVSTQEQPSSMSHLTLERTSPRRTRRVAGWANGSSTFRFLVSAAVGVITLALLLSVVEMSPLFAISFSIVAATLCLLVLRIRRQKFLSRVEQQLLDAVDLLVSSLQAGASAEMALQRVAREAEEPLRSELTEVVGRLRFGDSPQEVFAQFGERFSLETYRIFGLAMAVHWGTGGRLVPLLLSVSKSIRDRAEISRHVRLQSAQSRLSSIGILLAVYLIALVIWQSNPEGFAGLIETPVGSRVLASAIVLQALGLLWISKLTEFRY